MKINREQFLNDLNMVKAGLSAREFIEQSSCYVFQDGSVMTFNDEIACRKQIGLQVTGAVQANTLLAILEKIEDPELLVRENEAGELEFKGKRKGFGVTKDAEVFLPIDRVDRPGKWHKLAKEFLEAIQLVQHCVSADESKFTLTCIHLHPEYIEACDNLQAMRCKVRTGLKGSVLVRGTSLVGMLDLGMIEAALTRSWMHFRNEKGLEYSCRRYDDTYPSLDTILSLEGHRIDLPRGLAEATDRAAVFAADKTGDPLVIVSLAKGTIKLSGEGLTGWYEEVKKVAYEGPSIEFLIRAPLLTRISNEYRTAELAETRLKASGDEEGRSWEYVAVLGRNDEKAEKDGDDGKQVRKGRKST